jgi:hypothetical protein
MEHLSDFERGQIFGVRLDGASVAKTVYVSHSPEVIFLDEDQLQFYVGGFSLL